eukprot:scaffold71620_cov20-Tisochrysis_lutea.AAC.1
MQALQQKQMHRAFNGAHKCSRPGRLTVTRALGFPSFNTGWGAGATATLTKNAHNKEDKRDMVSGRWWEKRGYACVVSCHICRAVTPSIFHARSQADHFLL